ncbi:MAG: hypothetical protein QM767_19620 [Anaeromyxobacter sp.]
MDTDASCRWWVAASVAAAVAAGLACGGGEGAAPPGGADAAAAAPIDTAQGGQGVWVRRLGGLGTEQVVSMGAGGGGTTVLNLVGDPGPTGLPPYDLGLVRLRDDGSIAWAKPFHGSYGLTWLSVAVSGMGNTFLSFHTDCVVGNGCMDLGAGQATGSVVVKLDPSGRVVWQRAIAATDGLSAVTVDGNGGVALAVYRDGKRLVRYRWDGSRVYDVAAPDVGGPAGPYPLAIGLDPAGNLAVGDGSAFYVLDPSGKLRWKADLGAGRIVSIGATARGTVVAVAEFQDVIEWAGTRAITRGGVSGVFLAVAEASGAPRFGREVGGDERSVRGAAVDPAGRVAILTTAFGGAVPRDRLEKWNLAGELLWSRELGATAWAVTVDPASHHVRAGGALYGTVDFGTGPTTSRGDSDGWVLDVLP